MIVRLGKVSASAAAVLLALTGLTACSGAEPGGKAAPASPGASTTAPSGAAGGCADVEDLLVGAVQRYVDAYGAPVGGAGQPSGSSDAGSRDTDLRNALSQTRDAVARRGCDAQAFQESLRTGLAGVSARGPVARAVLLRIDASITGRASEVAETRTVEPTDDLARALASVGPGSTLRLAAGTYRLDETQVLLQGVTLLGAGRDRTVLASVAGDAGLLVLTDGRVELRGLTLRHRGARPASGVIGGPTSSLVLTDARVAGARGSGNGRTGGAGVLMSGSDGVEAGRGTTLEVTGTELRGNSSSGVLLLGRHRASIRSSRFVGNGQCGVCFAGRSSGAVRGSTFVGNGAGVAVLDRAAPAVVHNRFTGGQVGVQAGASARPVLRGNRVEGAARAALIFTGRAAGRVDRTTCRDVRFGIVVSPDALPLLGRNDCSVARTR